MTFIRTTLFSFLFLFSTVGHSKVIQIIHTNDLHSYFQGTRAGLGGYARLKGVIDDLRGEAKRKNIETFYFDAGDFGEGSSFYFSNQGVDSLRALDLLGVDVTVLGNHDFIMGGRELRNQMLNADLKATMLSANLRGKFLMGLDKLIPARKDFKVGDLTMRVFGLTTNEIHYMYPLIPFGYIANSHNTGISEAKRAQKDNIDFTIALTHIGFEYDIQLVEKSRTIDLVIGGHSHTRLPRPQLVKNLGGRLIPIVQAGANSGHVGSMIVDIKGKGDAELIDYKMIDITMDLPEDQMVKSFVDEAVVKREQYFKRSWDEVIGHTNIRLSGSRNGQMYEFNTCWSEHIARMTRETAKADLGLQMDVFQGEEIQPGPVTFGDMVDNFPHFRKWGDKGWKISRAVVSGFLLKQVINLMANSELGIQVTIDGLSVKDKNGLDRRFKPQRDSVEEALIGGENISNVRFYSIAIPKEITFGLFKTANAAGLAVMSQLRTVKNSHYWGVLENYIRKNSPLECLKD